MVTRRRFLTLGAAGVVSAGLLGEVALGASPVTGVENSNVNAALFSGRIGQDFVIRHNETGVTKTIRLIEVRNIDNAQDRKRGIRRESFSLLFSGDKTDILDQGVYEFSDGMMPDVPVLIVPVTGEPGIYEVNFNFLKS